MDWTNVGSQAVVALTPVVSLVVVYYSRLVFDRIPRVVLPLIAALFPAVLTMLGNYIEATDLNPIAMAALGGLATWLREVWSTWREHGLRA